MSVLSVKKERLKYVDFIKGFAILLVFLGHVVQFTYNGEVRNDRLLIKDRKLAPGDFVEVHYDVDEVGVHPLNDVCLRRVRELIICFIIMLPVGLLFYYLEKNGMI